MITDGVDTGQQDLARQIHRGRAARRLDYLQHLLPGLAAYGGCSAAVAAAMANCGACRATPAGACSRVDRKYTLEDVFRDLQEELRSQYSISYTPTNSKKDGTFRKLDMRAVEQGLQGPDAQRLLRDGAGQIRALQITAPK